MSVTDMELSHLREQAEFMALGGQNSAASWAKVAEALAELEQRRSVDGRAGLVPDGGRLGSNGEGPDRTATTDSTTASYT